MRRGHKIAVWATFAVVATASVAAYGTTQRRIRGIITAVDGGASNVTISPLQGHRPCVTGRVDPTRTRIIVDGHPPSCPMCREQRWEQVAWRPFPQLIDFPLAELPSVRRSVSRLAGAAPAASGP